MRLIHVQQLLHQLPSVQASEPCWQACQHDQGHQDPAQRERVLRGCSNVPVLGTALIDSERGESADVEKDL